MYCRNCGKEVNVKAVACIGCGFPPLSEKSFCHNCGTSTNEKQVMCVKCGVSLETKARTGRQRLAHSGTEYTGIYRSSNDKWIFGFCGGLAHKYGVQPSLMRVLAIISAFFVVGWLYLIGPFLPSYPTKNA